MSTLRDYVLAIYGLGVSLLPLQACSKEPDWKLLPRVADSVDRRYKYSWLPFKVRRAQPHSIEQWLKVSRRGAPRVRRPEVRRPGHRGRPARVRARTAGALQGAARIRIVGTSDGRTLYVAELGGRRTWAYPINGDGTLGERRLVVAKGSDGMTIDADGRLYLTNLQANAIDIHTPKGDLVESIPVPERPSNAAFGGRDRRTLFITAQTSLYAVRMRVAGADPR